MDPHGFIRIEDISERSPQPHVAFVLDLGGERRAGWVTHDALLQLEGATPTQSFEAHTGLLRSVALANMPADGTPIVITFELLAQGLTQIREGPRADPLPHEEITIADMEKGPMG